MPPRHSARISVLSSPAPDHDSAPAGTPAARRAAPSAGAWRRARPSRRGRRSANTSTMRLVSLYGHACSTNAGRSSPSRRPRALASALADGDAGCAHAEPCAQRRVVVRPALLHAHPDLEVDAAAEELEHRLARLRSRSPSSSRRPRQQDRALARLVDQTTTPIRRASPSCSNDSMPTAVAYGTSSPSSRKIFSRTYSAARKRSSRSVRSSAP